MMARILVRVSAVLSLLLCFATGVLWVRTYTWATSVKWVPRSDRSDFYVSSAHGMLGFESEFYGPETPEDPYRRGNGLSIYSAPIGGNDGWAAQWDIRFQHAGITYATDVIPHAYYARIIVVPLWLPFVLTLIMPLVWGRSWISKRRRRAKGLCIRCGYDLRGSDERCPECGAPTPPGLVPSQTTNVRGQPVTGQRQGSTQMRRRIILLGSALAAAALCMYGSYKLGWHDGERWTQYVIATAPPKPAPAPPPLDRSTQFRYDGNIDYQRRHVLSVEYIRLIDSKYGPASLTEFKLTNISGKPIVSVSGSIQLFDRDGHPVGGVADGGPVGSGKCLSGRYKWELPDAVRSAIVDGNAGAYFCADDVRYADGLSQEFGPQHPVGSYVSAPLRVAK